MYYIFNGKNYEAFISPLIVPYWYTLFFIIMIFQMGVINVLRDDSTRLLLELNTPQRK